MNKDWRARRGLFAGLVVVAIGVILLLDQLGIVPAERAYRLWPLILVYVGVLNLFRSINWNRRMWGLFLIFLGALFELREFGYLHFRIENLWPAFLIALGLLMMIQALNPGRIGPRILAHMHLPSHFTERLHSSTPSDSQFDYVAIFSGVKRLITTKSFRNGRLSAAFGGFEIDLRQADMDVDTAYIEANAVLGGGEIRVPQSWTVSMQGLAFMGAYVDETMQVQVPGSGKTLVIKGMVLLGGITIKN